MYQPILICKHEILVVCSSDFLYAIMTLVADKFSGWGGLNFVIWCLILGYVNVHCKTLPEDYDAFIFERNTSMYHCYEI